MTGDDVEELQGPLVGPVEVIDREEARAGDGGLVEGRDDRRVGRGAPADAAAASAASEPSNDSSATRPAGPSPDRIVSHGAWATVLPPGQQADHRTMAPARRAAFTACRAVVVFPMPASPSSSTSRPLPSAAAANAPVSAAPTGPRRGSSLVSHDNETLLGISRRQPRSGAPSAKHEREDAHDHHQTNTLTIDEAVIGDFAGRIAEAAISGFELAAMELGTRLGLYEALAAGPATAPELATRAEIDDRYAREWLEQQATAGVVHIDADPVDGDPAARVFSLPIEHQICLLDPDSLALVSPLATFAAAAGTFLPQLEGPTAPALASASAATGPLSATPKRPSTGPSSPTCWRPSGSRPCPT